MSLVHRCCLCYEPDCGDIGLGQVAAAQKVLLWSLGADRRLAGFLHALSKVC